MNTDTLLKPFIFSLFFLLSILSYSSQLSLSTNSRWIVSPSGERFKLKCVNWVGHVSVMIPEGLEKQPLSHIAQMVHVTGFNCVRLTWAVYMYTRYANRTVGHFLDSYNLAYAKEGMAENNPEFLGMSIVDVHKEVINELAANNIYVVLDNHVSEPIWCCGDTDGNGFFGDKFFDPEEWLLGLSIVANRYKDVPNVIGMSLRNELRGPSQNTPQWYNYMQQGAEAVHNQSPDFLVIISGLNTDTNLAFLKQKPFDVTFKNKLVFESHWYAFGNPRDKWKYQTNAFCGQVTKTFQDQSGFLLDGSDSFPLFLSEFGIDQRGEDEMQNAYLSCILAHVAGSDMDWALWTLQGSYMFRENVQNMEEFYGVLNYNWKSVRNTTMMKKLWLPQQILRDPSRSDPEYHIMSHPQTGKCIHVDDDNKIYNRHCREYARWSYDSKDGKIKSSDGNKCLTATGNGLPVTLSNHCTNDQSTWTKVSGSKLHLATKDKTGKLLCLDWNDPESNTIVTRKCLCLDDDTKDVARCEENPQRQWFKLVRANIK